MLLNGSVTEAWLHAVCDDVSSWGIDFCTKAWAPSEVCRHPPQGLGHVPWLAETCMEDGLMVAFSFGAEGGSRHRSHPPTCTAPAFHSRQMIALWCCSLIGYVVSREARQSSRLGPTMEAVGEGTSAPLVKAVP
ncbi:hypothetical protein GCM10027030_33040 [Luteococcus sediminum]